IGHIPRAAPDRAHAEQADAHRLHGALHYLDLRKWSTTISVTTPPSPTIVGEGNSTNPSPDGRGVGVRAELCQRLVICTKLISTDRRRETSASRRESPAAFGIRFLSWRSAHDRRRIRRSPRLATRKPWPSR